MMKCNYSKTFLPNNLMRQSSKILRFSISAMNIKTIYPNIYSNRLIGIFFLISRNQTQELFANYIQCSGLSSELDSERRGKSQCLEHLVCLYANPVATIPYTNIPVDKAEKDVISM